MSAGRGSVGVGDSDGCDAVGVMSRICMSHVTYHVTYMDESCRMACICRSGEIRHGSQ